MKWMVKVSRAATVSAQDRFTEAVMTPPEKLSGAARTQPVGGIGMAFRDLMEVCISVDQPLIEIRSLSLYNEVNKLPSQSKSEKYLSSTRSWRWVVNMKTSEVKRCLIEGTVVNGLPSRACYHCCTSPIGTGATQKSINPTVIIISQSMNNRFRLLVLRRD